MKKAIYLLMAMALMLALLPGASFAHTEADPMVVDLLAGQTMDIGDVEVWNDGDNLYVQFLYTGPDCGFLEVHLQVSAGAWAEDVLTKKGNPIPGHFEYYYPTSGTECFPEHTFTISLSEKGWASETQLNIAAHAALGQEECMTIVSGDGQTMVTQRRSGDAVGFTPVNAAAVRAWEPGPNYPNDGPVDTTWEHDSLWDQGLTIDLRDLPVVTDWIWESYRVLDPVYGTALTLQRTFDIGYPTRGALAIACDNGYEAFLNGTSLGSHGVNAGWRDSDLTEGFVPQDGWNVVTIYSLLDDLVAGTNVLTIDAANEYFNTDDPPNPWLGTVANNPGACIFVLKDICHLASGETAWGCGEDNCIDFPGKNWATYFTYTVQEPPPPVIAGWTTGRGGNYSLNSTDSTQARLDLAAAYPGVVFRALSGLTAANLAGVDVVVLSSVKGNSGAITPILSGDEQTALYNFVLGGGCAILFPDNDTFAGAGSDPANESLIDPFGLDIMGTLGGVYYATVSAAAWTTVASYSGNYAGWFDDTGTATILATLNANAQPSLVEFAPDFIASGSGRVVVYSDANVFFGGGASRYTYNDNSQLFLDTVDACFQP